MLCVGPGDLVILGYTIVLHGLLDATYVYKPAL